MGWKGWVAALLAALLLGAAGPAGAGRVGIVMLHGLGGTPLGTPSGGGRVVGGELIGALRKAGYLVATPELCFSGRRMYDRAFPDCFADVDVAVAGLRAQGATTILVGGQSLGALLAFGYAAARPDVAAVIACAPAGDPASKRSPALRAALAQARAAIDAGTGDVVQSFAETNTGPHGRYDFTVRATPRAYVSFHDPDGPANLDALVARIAVPVLWVAGSRDATQPAAAPAGLNADPHTTFVEVDADHLGTPDAGTPAIVDWLHALLPQQ